MPTPTYTPLATITLGSSASSVTFSSIPATYRDLILVMNFSETSTGGDIRLRYNGDTGSNYSQVYMESTGSSALSGSGTYAFHYLNQRSRNSGIRIADIIQVMDYSATDKHKTALGRLNNETQDLSAYAYRWANTAAITSIEVLESSVSFTAGSTFNLFGVIA